MLSHLSGNNCAVMTWILLCLVFFGCFFLYLKFVSRGNMRLSSLSRAMVIDCEIWVPDGDCGAVGIAVLFDTSLIFVQFT